MTSFVSVLCRVCVMCSHLLCPYLVCFLSSLSAIELILVQPCLSNYLWFTCVFIVLSVQFDFVWSTRYFPVYPVSLSCLVLPWCLIKYYYLSLYPRLRVPVPPSCVHRDRRPDLTVSGAHSPRFVFRFWKSFVLLFFCLSRGKEVTTRPPAIAHCRTAWEFGGIAASPLAASPHARGSREISAAGGGSPKPAGWFPGCRSPRRAIRGRSRHRVAADSKPTGSPLTQAAGSPLTHARRIAADSSPPDWRWLMPAGRRYP